jgi:glycosyltransferase involved in cell wall biosynthesis
MHLDQITPLILTYNEEPNIDRTLSKLTWASQILIVDSYSDDRTLEILASYPQIKILQRKFDTFADQCNFGLNHIKTEWVLSLDADYCLSQKFIDRLNQLVQKQNVSGYKVPLSYCVFGQPLKGTLLPPRIVLYRQKQATYENDGHAHRVIIEGKVNLIQDVIYHDDRKPLSRWLWAQDRYLKIEAQKLSTAPWTKLSWGDRIRTLKFLAPFIILFYCLILKGGVLDGWRGWYYAFQRMLAEMLLSLRLIEKDFLEDSTD